MKRRRRLPTMGPVPSQRAERFQARHVLEDVHEADPRSVGFVVLVGFGIGLVLGAAVLAVGRVL